MLERLTIRISGEMNDWLDIKAEESGLTKSAIIYIALENYRKEQTQTVILSDLLNQLELLNELRKLSIDK